MRIGIITYQCAHNFGAVLQCYALQQKLSQMGHNVEVINYRQPYISSRGDKFSLSLFLKMFPHIKGQLQYLIRTPRRIVQDYLYVSMFKKLNMTKPCTKKTIPDDYDAYVIGSDQLWSHHCWGSDELDEVYFGEFKRKTDSKVYAYAISAHRDSVTKIPLDDFNRLLPNFTTLSFRERKIAEAIKKKTGYKSRIDIDPTLLTVESDWLPIINTKWKNRKYIFVYQNRWKEGEEDVLYKKAKLFAKKQNCELIMISPTTYGLKDLYSVEDFISLIYYAQCVYTSSFHAVAFSLIFRKPLYAVCLDDGGDGRYKELLEHVESSSSIVDLKFNPNNIPMVNSANLLSRLACLREDSLEYLSNL